jgi:hypothetical protein
VCVVTFVGSLSEYRGDFHTQNQNDVTTLVASLGNVKHVAYRCRCRMVLLCIAVDNEGCMPLVSFLRDGDLVTVLRLPQNDTLAGYQWRPDIVERSLAMDSPGYHTAVQLLYNGALWASVTRMRCHKILSTVYNCYWATVQLSIRAPWRRNCLLQYIASGSGELKFYTF